jgi:hypothetical protein
MYPIKRPINTDKEMEIMNSLTRVSNPEPEKRSRCSFVEINFFDMLNKIMATASFKRPSPKIMEWILGKSFFGSRESTATVSVAVRVEDKRSMLLSERP